MPSMPDAIPVLNTESSVIPAFGLMARLSVDANGILNVGQPTVDGEICIVNGPIAIPPANFGNAIANGHGTYNPRVLLAYDEQDGVPAVGESWGAKAGQWTARKDMTGFLIDGGAGYGVVNAVRWVNVDFVPGGGTVTSVAMTVPSILTVSGSPIIGGGTFAVDLATETANYIFAGPVTGAAAIPTFRSMQTADISPNIVTFPKLLNATDESLLIGRGAGAGAGNFQEITLDGLVMVGTVLSPDLAVASSAVYDCDKITGFSMVGGNLRLAWTRQTIENKFNSSGQLIDNYLASTSSMHIDVDPCLFETCCSASALSLSCTKSASSGVEGNTITFTSTPGGGTLPYTFDWDWDDGTAHGTTEDPNHVYATVGTYDPVLTVTDACGKVITCSSGTIAITAPEPGVDCGTALAMDIDTGYSGETGVGFPDAQWFRYTPAVAGSYRVILTAPDTKVSCTIYQGENCETKATLGSIISEGEGSPVCFDVTIGAIEYIWLEVQTTDGASPWAYTVIVEAGAC
ncbi:MAG: hypothetical protein C0467_27950 [Planctomycetaceae bacterium]|nr:hypothetical protein [Planctomycetaceae bacterium]